MAPTPPFLSKPIIELPHLKASPDLELDSLMAKLEKDRAVADAESFHNKVRGVGEPTSAVGRRHLAAKYPAQYPQWSHLVEVKGPGKHSDARQGQQAQGTATARHFTNSNAKRGNRGGYLITASGRGRGRGSYATTRRGNRGGPGQNIQWPASKQLSGSSFRPASATQSQANEVPLNPHIPESMLPHLGNRGQRDFITQSRTSGAFTTEAHGSSDEFKTWEEWNAENDRRKRKQEEEDAAMLLEENKKALFTELACDVESLSSRSMSTEPVSDRSGTLPQYPLLEPMRMTPSSIASSSRVSPTKTTRLPGTVAALSGYDPISVAPAEPKEVKNLSPVKLDKDVEEMKELVPGLPTTSGFQAPDWRARGRTEPRSLYLSDTASEDSGPDEIAKAETSPDMTDDIDEITAAWDRALLGPS